MANIEIYLLISIAVPLIIAAAIIRGRTGKLLMYFLFGMLICLFCGELNAFICSFFDEEYNEYSSSIAPIIEEIVKAFPVLIYAFVFAPNRQKLLECAMLVGVGFALQENAVVIARNIDHLTVSLAIARACGAGLMHVITTTLVGLGMSFVKSKKKLFYTGTIGLLSVAIIYHSIYNSLVLSNYEFLGLILPIITSVPIMIIHTKKYLKKKNEKE